MLDNLSIILSVIAIIGCSYWVVSAWKRYKNDKKQK